MSAIVKDIIISGAGPTGLMLANQLTRFGIDYLILDQKAGPTNQSRALVVHARSMEIYQQLGLSDHIVADGQKNDGVNFYKNGKLAASVTIVNPDENASPFPYMMMYEQSKNETLLYKNLLAHDRDVQWNTTVVSITKENNFYILNSRQHDTDITYQCKYLIACDGNKSLVRDFAGVPFTGGDYMNVFFVADTCVDENFSSQKLSLFISKHGINMLFPMKGEKHFRALGILPKQYYHHDDIPFQEILDKVKEGMKMPVKFYNTNWHSTYRLHHKKVKLFSKDNIFFAGDSAHVHSPAGGQGMNTGLQDAYNLAWKLALVQQKKAGIALLNSYHEERNPVAEALLKTTDRLFSAMSTDNFLYGIFRLYVVPFFIPIITRYKSVRKQIFLSVSQIKINYFSSSLSKGRAGKVQAGLRLPYFFITQDKVSISIYQLLNERVVNPFTILFYKVSAESFGRLDIEIFNMVEIEINNINTKIFKENGFPDSFVMMVRPDNYIGYISPNADVDELSNFMEEQYFLLTPILTQKETID